MRNKSTSGEIHKKIMKVLVACEFSDRVRSAFERKGHDAWSCDLLPSENPENKKHIQGDVLEILNGLKCWKCNGVGEIYKYTSSTVEGMQSGKCPICQDGYIKWDLMIAHPPCTYLSYAATKSWNDNGRVWLRLEALVFFAKLWTAPIERICIENPSGCASPTIAKYSQVIQPYYFGDTESKRTWLWLKNLPKLIHHPEAPLFNDSTHVKPKIYGYYKRGKKKGQPIYGNNYMKFSEDRGHERSRFWSGIAEAMANQWG